MLDAVGVQPTASKAFVCFGADNRIRTDDLILTKDVLCLLSYISKKLAKTYFSRQLPAKYLRHC